MPGSVKWYYEGGVLKSKPISGNRTIHKRQYQQGGSGSQLSKQQALSKVKKKEKRKLPYINGLL